MKRKFSIWIVKSGDLDGFRIRLPTAIGSKLHNVIAYYELYYRNFYIRKLIFIDDMLNHTRIFVKLLVFSLICRLVTILIIVHWTLTLNKHFLFVIFNLILCFLRSHIHLSCHPNYETLEWLKECDLIRLSIQYLHFTTIYSVFIFSNSNTIKYIGNLKTFNSFDLWKWVSFLSKVSTLTSLWLYHYVSIFLVLEPVLFSDSLFFFLLNSFLFSLLSIVFCVHTTYTMPIPICRYKNEKNLYKRNKPKWHSAHDRSF